MKKANVSLSALGRLTKGANDTSNDVTKNTTIDVTNATGNDETNNRDTDETISTSNDVANNTTMAVTKNTDVTMKKQNHKSKNTANNISNNKGSANVNTVGKEITSEATNQPFILKKKTKYEDLHERKTYYIHKDYVKQIDTIRKKTNISQSEIINMALEQFFKNLKLE